MTRKTMVLLIALTILMSACSDDAGAPSTAAASTTVTTQATPTSQAPTTTSTTAATTEVVATPLDVFQAAEFADTGLLPNGLIGAQFGDDADAVMELLTLFLGEPVIDEGWTDAEASFCRGTEVRFPQWDWFFVILTDAETAYAPAGTRHFAFWAAFDDSFYVTPEFIWPTITTLEQVETVYGPIEPAYDDALGVWTYSPPANSLDAGIQYEFSDPAQPDSTVIALSAGEHNICGE